MQGKMPPYRWVVLAAFALVNLTIQTLWISYAPIGLLSAGYYGVSELAIGFFAMSFMLAFVPLSIPASWAIDRFGFRLTVGFGVVVMGACGILRGVVGPRFGLAMACTVGLAAIQPLLLNSWTTVPAKWFLPEQRATAVGIVTLGNLIGTALGMVLPPALAQAGMGIGRMQLIFGLAAALSALVFVILAREEPERKMDGSATEARALVLDGLRQALASRDVWLSLFVSFIGLGIFNGVTTWIEAIVRPRGLGPGDAGNLGAVMIGGGLLGAILLPAVSDRLARRRPFMAIGLAGAIPGVVGLAIAPNLATLYVSSIILGFFLVSALPITMQYAAEITRPLPEGTSNGLIQLFGQGAVVFVYIMGALKSPGGSFSASLFLSAGLLAIGIACVALMRENRPGAARL